MLDHEEPPRMLVDGLERPPRELELASWDHGESPREPVDGLEVPQDRLGCLMVGRRAPVES